MGYIYCERCNIRFQNKNSVELQCGAVCKDCSRLSDSDECASCGAIGNIFKYDRYCQRGYCENCADENNQGRDDWPTCANCGRDELCKKCVAFYLSEINEVDHYCICKQCVEEYASAF